MNNVGNLIILAAPSGAGKTSLMHALTQADPHLVISVSHTTRSARPLEKNAVDYYFVDDAEFQRMVKQQEFLEHATVFSHQYGTSRQMVLDTIQRGFDVILEIDWQGAQQIQQRFPNAVSIFILPPSLVVLKQRLEQRDQDSSEVIAARMAAAQEEVSHCHDFNYVVVNDEFDRALADLQHIIHAQRLITSRQQQNLASLLSELLESQ